MSYQSGYVRSGRASIYYEETGSGRPVVFAHAGVADRRMWDPQFENPVQGHRYVRSDMRGFGLSEWVAEPYSPHRDLLSVIEDLDLRDLVLVGCSMGGKTAMELAVSAPDRMAGLVVIGAGLPGWEPADGGYTPPHWENLDPLWEAEDWDAIVEIDAEVWGVGVGRSREDMDPRVYAKFREMDHKPVTTELERDEYFSWMEPPINDRVDQIGVPALVIVGEHDLPDIVTSTALLAERISHRERVAIPAAAHLASLERPDIFNPLLEEFLGSI